MGPAMNASPSGKPPFMTFMMFLLLAWLAVFVVLLLSVR
jgi:hypothetical protein